MTDRVCAITGVGPGNGAAFARRFASAGYRVALLARSQERLEQLEQEIPGSRGFLLDVADEPAVDAVFARVREELGPVDVLVQNAGSAVFGDALSVTRADFEAAWRTNALGLFLCTRAVVPDMQKAGRGTIVVVGATASTRGGAPFAAFASAKAAQRILAQSLARLLGPQGIHVAYLVIDGVIDMPRTRAFFRDRPDDFFLNPDHIAQTVHHLAEQERSAWTFELDVRPFGEKW
jgi:NAD(P)-dependent dehydrogenase (short-subunit alcohol dehydrogenase family)